MKLGVTCLLVICSLGAAGEIVRTTSESRSDSSFSSPSPAKPEDKLHWNVDPVHWEGLVGHKAAADTSPAPVIALAARGKPASDYDLTHSAGDPTSAVDEARLERILRQSPARSGRRLGESDYVFTSPILEGLLPRRMPEDASLGEKILNLPVVRLVRPLPMPNPPGGGKYFKWGSRDKAWTEFCQPLPGPGRMDNGM